MEDKRGTDGTTTLLYLILINLLPIGGLFVFDWNADNLLFAYFVQNGLLVVLYSSLVPFATQEPELDEYSPRAVPIPFISARSGWRRIVGWLPPINYWNVQFVLWPLSLGLAFWQVSGTVLLDLSTLSIPERGGGHGIPLGQYLDAVAAAGSFEVAMVAVLTSGLACTVISRDFFGQERYARFSAPELAEIPLRIGLYWFVTTVLASAVVVLTSPLASIFDHSSYAEFRVVLLFVTMTLLLERGLVSVQRGNEPGRVVYWVALFWSGPKNSDDRVE
ncbi:hypothetical protein AUR64_19330 [Haloprofundus marisrubri]|uniref:Uncharacterized protein n=1 Tax=Haloprofundus marisrubri TaxID=1514971 RepID=A0A0W1R4L6_9EURY|nr:DUF6498-containing protein [Haloprofundus marisrubri]KTG08385.1 hypothetical protein AUR64_19330 [Haloprofundus marisrubri]